MRKVLIIGFVFLGVFLAGHAGEVLTTQQVSQVHASQVNALSPASLEEFRPRLGTYYYRINWGRSDIAEAEIDVDRQDDFYQIAFKAKTRNMVDRMFKVRFKGEGRIAAEELAPVRTYFEERTRSKTRETEIVFNPDGSVESVRVLQKKGQPEETHKRQLDPQTFVLDPFTAVFMVRHLDWKSGESDSFEVFTGKTRYLLTLNCQGQTTLAHDGKDRQVWVITAQAKNLDDPRKSSKTGETIVFLTADSQKEVLFIKSKTKFGKVSVDLISFIPRS